MYVSCSLFLKPGWSVSLKKLGLLLAIMFTVCILINKELMNMKYKFVIEDDNGVQVLRGVEFELRDLVVNGIQVVRDSNLDFEDTRQMLGNTDINNVMHLFRGETND